MHKSTKLITALTQNISIVQDEPAGPSEVIDFDASAHGSAKLSNLKNLDATHQLEVSLLTGGSDRPYVFGLTKVLISKGVVIDLIASDELTFPEFSNNPNVNFLNLRGSTRSDVGFLKKISRVSWYYAKLVRYAATSKPKIFHILWNNKFESLDRTVLMLYYRLLRKQIVLTAHNVNAGKRDSQDTVLNRVTLKIQYRLAHHIFVHTEKMKRELIEEFGVPDTRVGVIPFGINNAVPNTSLTPVDAKRRLEFGEEERIILFFGRITPYKGIEYLIDAFRQLAIKQENYRLVIAGKPDRCEEYWRTIQKDLDEDIRSGRILLRAHFIPDNETEVYFKAADALVLPYKDIFQSGVLFLGLSFGLPVLTATVGSLSDEIVEGKTGFLFQPRDPVDLARAVERYFASDLYQDLNNQRSEIRTYANERHSWDLVSQVTLSVYAALLQIS